MDIQQVRQALAEGNLSAVIDTLSVDERVDYTMVSLTAGGPDGTITLARVGLSHILIQPGGQHSIHTHGDEDMSRECFAVKSVELGELVIHQNAAAREIQTDPRAQVLLNMGLPPEAIVGAVMERQQEQATVDLSVPVAQLDMLMPRGWDIV